MLNTMTIDSILAELDAEIARLTQARNLLARAGATASGTRKSKAAGKPRKTRVLSADARKRIADAQRRRWAAQKSKARKDNSKKEA
ncbi:MAG TPA: hypothetical protein VKB38_17010 [Terracidiphilus sp.]|nr:hypothetical protein [Terracidiphilus sp.]